MPDGAERVLPIGDKPLVIGRLPESEIFVRDSFISRVHAGISCINGRFVLKDLGSCNGTYCNGSRVFEGPLKNGDKIQIGNTTLLFEMDSQSGNCSLLQFPQINAAPTGPGGAQFTQKIGFRVVK
jgi:pSer/pThr/pTyr-binding forkhead associated (FHA) protein